MRELRDITQPDSDQYSKPEQLSRRHLLTRLGSAVACLGLQRLAHADGDRDTVSDSSAFQGCSPAPTPIPGGFNARKAFGPRFPDRFFHLFLPGPGSEPSTIFNFRGEVAILNIHGTGTRTELNPNTGAPINSTHNLPFATDVRFMHGTYVGGDGSEHQGTFAFF